MALKPLQPIADLNDLGVAALRQPAACVRFGKRLRAALAQRIHQRLDGRGGGAP
jgi:hypothetical protein